MYWNAAQKRGSGAELSEMGLLEYFGMTGMLVTQVIRSASKCHFELPEFQASKIKLIGRFARLRLGGND